MKKNNKDLRILLNNESGVAIMMVMTAIVLLTTIMMTFSFDTNLNKIKSFNIEDRGQARLTAEAGMQFAMARLKLYKEAFNYVEKNASVKDFVKPESLNSIWNFPFVYPIPVTGQMNQIQKDAIAKFAENTFLQGEMKLTINNISNQININMLRVALMTSQEGELDSQQTGDANASEDSEDYAIENQLINTLKFSIETKSRNDDYFASLYMGVDPIELVNVLRYNISDPESLESEGSARQLLSEIDTIPKFGPFSSWSELYAMPGWDDDLVDLIKNEFTVYGAIMIDLNKITEKLLRLLLPNISDQEVKDFFEYKNDPESPKFFNTLDDFKNYVINIGNIMNATEFDDRMSKFGAQGLKFGPSPSLFKVVSVGTKGRATYTLTAYVVLPAKPYKQKTYPKTEDDQNANGIPDANEVTPTEDDVDGDGIPNEEDKEDNRPAKTKKQKTQLLNPRIVEIFIS